MDSAIRPWIGGTSTVIELVGVAVIAGGLVWATYNWLKEQEEERYRRYRSRLGRSLLLGLEILVAADIVRTVALELTLESLGTLALLIFIRTFHSWALEVEIEGRWPWQAREQEPPETD